MSLLKKASGKSLRMTAANTKMKILHVGNHTIPCVGGVEQVIWQLAKEQVKEGHRVTILVFNTCSDNTTILPAEEKKEGVQIIRIPQYGVSFYRIPNPVTVLKHVAENDLVHVHGFGAWLDVVCLLKYFHGKKIVVTTHGGFYHTTQRKALKKAYRSILLPFIASSVDYFCVVSASDLPFILPLSMEKYSIIPNGLDISALTRIPLSGKKRTHFLFVGRISRNKRVDHLIRAFSYVVRKIPHAELSIVGEDWENLSTGLRKEMHESGLAKNVTFYGKMSTERVHDLYASAGIIVSASQYEGFGLTIIEGMAAGCVPCVNTIPTFIVFSSEGRGKAVDFSNSREAGETMVSLATMSPKKFLLLQKKCRTYSKKYSIDAIEKKHMMIYHKLLARGKI